MTEGEQGKYGRDGALWKLPPEGHLYKDAYAMTQQWNHVLSLATYLATKVVSG